MIEFFYDCSSPWTYLAFESIQPLAAEFDVAIDWRPILVGGIFNTVNPSVYQSRENPVPAKQRYMRKDLADWARMQDLVITFPPAVFPVNSAQAMRACIVASRHDRLVAFSRRVFRAYWSEDRDISQQDVLHACAKDAGLDADALLAEAASPPLKTILRANTDEVIARGGFGSPTIFVGHDDMYFGNDRMPLIRHAIAALRRA